VLAWAARYEELALTGVRSREVTERIGLHLQRFAEYLSGTYGHERLEGRGAPRCRGLARRAGLVGGLVRRR
jgi:hypothetical protein